MNEFGISPLPFRGGAGGGAFPRMNRLGLGLTGPTPTQFRAVQSPGLNLNCRGQFTAKLLKGRGL